MASNVGRDLRNQYECRIATPRANSACTLGSQERGKATLPSFSSCWPIAPLVSAAVIRPAANKIRPDCVFIISLLSELRATIGELAPLIGCVSVYSLPSDLTVARLPAKGVTMRRYA